MLIIFYLESVIVKEFETYIIECVDCMKVFPFEYGKARNIIKVPEVELIVITCPHCDIWEAVSDQRFVVFNILGLVTDSTSLLYI